MIVDEALSVGDAKFQTKCIEKMNEMMSKGTTVLFVSHSIEQINRFCTRAIWLDKGILRMDGKATDVTSTYEAFMKYGETGIEKKTICAEVSEETEIPLCLPEDEDILAAISKVKVKKYELQTFEELEVEVEYEVYVEKINDFLLGVALYTPTRDYIFGPNTYLENIPIPSGFGRHRVKYIVPKIMLLNGIYNIDVGIFNNKGLVIIDYKEGIEQISVKNDYFSEGLIYMEHKWEVVR